MTVDAASSEFQKPPQSELLVRRILSVAEILARVSQEAVENEPENCPSLELRYPELEVSKSES